MGILFSFGVIAFLSFGAVSARASSENQVQTSQVPLDYPLVQDPVINPDFLDVSRSFRVSAGLIQQNGDKFVNTEGLRLGLNYIKDNKWSYETVFNVFRNSNTRDFSTLSSQGFSPAVYKPKLSLRLGANYDWVYGKLTFGEKVRNFRLHVPFGLEVSQGSLERNNTSERLQTLGVYGGLLDQAEHWLELLEQRKPAQYFAPEVLEDQGQESSPRGEATQA